MDLFYKTIMNQTIHNMKEPICVAIDIETLSTRPTAAIISIAARAFTFSDPQPQLGCFNVVVNATTCAMYGLHFSESTVNFWTLQGQGAKRPYLDPSAQCVTLHTALQRLTEYINHARSQSPTGRILLWMQGTDFDAAILHHAYCQVLGSESIPWHHTELRDARTFIHGIIGCLFPRAENPYAIIPKDFGWVMHDALSDVDHLIHNVRHTAAFLGLHIDNRT